MWRAFFVLVVVGLLLLTACSGKQNTTTSTEVQITLTDFAIQSTRTEFQSGVTYHFVVTNKGQVPHEVMIMPPEMQAEMSMDMEELDKMALATVDQEKLPPGATYSFDFTFTEPAPDGKLEFACHLPGHYEAGMKLAISVK